MRLLTFIFLLISFTSFSQKKSILDLYPPSIWSEGKILTTDGKELAGLVSYHHAMSVGIKYGAISKNLTPRGVISFEFYDTLSHKLRNFYSMEFDQQYQFFEVLFDFTDFAVISKIDPINLNSSNPDQFNYPESNPSYSPSQTEIIFILNREGEIVPYLTIERSRLLARSPKIKYRIIDMNLLVKYMGRNYDEVSVYIKQYELNLGNKDDLIQVFDYYGSIR